ncbi:hypothetical protein TSUD_249100 [Trifolium subterraneum]|nr:hypothetical protein TSUD_249100 [Trifolium subterraneum]
MDVVDIFCENCKPAHWSIYCFIVDVPLSYSVTLGLEGIHRLRIVRHSGYHATSKSLVADLQLGQMMLMSVFNIVEQLGAFGIIDVPSGNARTDPFFLH